MAGRLAATAPNAERAERLGMSAASEKRIGNLFRADKDEDRARRAYETACEFYRRALDAEPFNHWVITQYLSMTAVLAPENVGDALVADYGAWWAAARQIADWDLRKATGEKQAWALATLAELELLGSIYGGRDVRSRASPGERSRASAAGSTKPWTAMPSPSSRAAGSSSVTSTTGRARSGATSRPPPPPP